MAKSDNRRIIGVDNAWFGDCDNDADVKKLCIESSANLDIPLLTRNFVKIEKR